jgi:RHS repeat-associated protein
VARVEFFIGSTLLATVPQAPYAYNWMNVAAGSYTITAKATDDRGAVTLSDPVAVNVTATPGAAQVYYIDSDHLNTPRVITDANNNIVWQWDNSDPFGGNLPQEDPGNTGNRLEFNLRFPGQYFDRETGLHYNYFRTYDPNIGRYIESDPIGLDGGINTYAYVGANPISYVDHLGLRGLMPGGYPWEPPVLDDGKTCGPLFVPPNVDENGCTNIGGGLSFCPPPLNLRRKPGSLGQAKGTDALRRENEAARAVDKALGLDKGSTHKEISGLGLPGYQEILKYMKELGYGRSGK